MIEYRVRLWKHDAYFNASYYHCFTDSPTNTRDTSAVCDARRLGTRLANDCMRNDILFCRRSVDVNGREPSGLNLYHMKALIEDVIVLDEMHIIG